MVVVQDQDEIQLGQDHLLLAYLLEVHHQVESLFASHDQSILALHQGPFLPLFQDHYQILGKEVVLL